MRTSVLDWRPSTKLAENWTGEELCKDIAVSWYSFRFILIVTLCVFNGLKGISPHVELFIYMVWLVWVRYDHPRCEDSPAPNSMSLSTSTDIPAQTNRYTNTLQSNI